MHNRKLLSKFGLIGIAALAIGAAAYFAGNSGSASDEATLMTRGDSYDPVPSAPPAGNAGTGTWAGATEERPAYGEAEDGKALNSDASSSVASAPGVSPVAGSLTSSLNRQIVSTASMQLQVDNVGGSFEEVGRIATTAGGFIASSSFSYRGDDQIASVTIRVPADSYQAVLSSLRGLSVKVDAENSDAQDVTEEYTDLGSRLRTLEAAETQLLTLLGRAESIADILTVQDRLNYTRMEIEQVKGRVQMLDNLTSLATITVHLQPVTGAVGSEPNTGVNLGDEVSEAWDKSLDFLTDVAAGVVSVVVFAWWVPVIGLPLVVAVRAMTRNRPQTVD